MLGTVTRGESGTRFTSRSTNIRGSFASISESRLRFYQCQRGR